MSFRNVQIKTRLYLLAALMLVALISIGSTSIFFQSKISNDMYTIVTQNMKPLEQANSLIEYTAHLSTTLKNYLNAPDPADKANLIDEARQTMADIIDLSDQYLVTASSAKELYTPGELQSIANIKLLFTDKYKPLIEDVFAMSSSAQGDLAAAKLVNEGDPIFNSIAYTINSLFEKNMRVSENSANTNKINAQEINTSYIIILILVSLFAIIFSTLTINSIVKPIRNLNGAVDNIVKGNFDINLDLRGKDDVTKLSSNFRSMVTILKSLINNMTEMAQNQENGMWDSFIDSDKFEGDYKTMATVVNSMCNSQIEATKTAVNCILEIGRGDFDASMPEFEGDKKIFNMAAKELSSNLKTVSQKINELIGHAVDGDLNLRADISEMTGGWLEITKGINALMDAVVSPINECTNALVEMSKGNLRVTMNGNYNGDFDVMKLALNNTTAEISSYIEEINSVLKSISDDDFRVDITREYIGDFISIKESINNIVYKFNAVFNEINSAAEQVSSGASQISETAMNLADGASQQALSIQNFSDSISSVSNEIKQTEQNALNANSLAIDAKQSAISGNKEMQNLLNAMKEIKEASDKVNDIIKVINNIALQTNLLALNATIEAARAGVHGKGFSVVAEQVGMLAASSQNSARGTSELIENTLLKIKDGMAISQTTAKSLDAIVTNVSGVSDLVSEISDASQKQRSDMDIIQTGIDNISEVVQRNSSTSEESAATAEELNSQSIMLHNMINVFKLK